MQFKIKKFIFVCCNQHAYICLIALKNCVPKDVSESVHCNIIRYTGCEDEVKHQKQTIMDTVIAVSKLDLNYI